MKYSVDKQDRYTVFQIQEENLNSIIAPNLKSEFVILSNEGVSNLILDLSQVAYVDSSGLSAILTADRLWKQLGSFILTGIHNENIDKLIKISKLDSILTIVPTVEESVEFVLMEEVERELNLEGEEN